MNTKYDTCGQCSLFQAAKRATSSALSHLCLCGVVALFCCGTALALEINQANEAELDSIRGMGPSLSAKVLQARAHGPFKDWSDLMRRVAGIRQNKAQQFSEQGLTVNGQAFVTKP